MPDDFMPIDGWDHLELWVGNAKQAAYYYEHAFGFTPVAYAGPETAVRDRASYVLAQGDIRLVLSTALREGHEIARHTTRHGDGVRDIALAVPDATEAYRQAVQRGARGVVDPLVRQPRRLRRAVPPRLQGNRGRGAGGRRARRDRPLRRQRRARAHEPL